MLREIIGNFDINDEKNARQKCTIALSRTYRHTVSLIHAALADLSKLVHDSGSARIATLFRDYQHLGKQLVWYAHECTTIAHARKVALIFKR
jgi:hypothetical protein